MLKTAVSILVLLALPYAQAADSVAQKCASYAVKSTLFNYSDSGFLADIASGKPENIPVWAQNGRIVVNKKSPLLKSFDDSYPAKVTVRYADGPKNLESTLEFQYGSNKQVSKATVSNKDQKRSWQFNADCEVEREEVNDRTVMYDKKFCRMLQDQFKKSGDGSLNEVAAKIAECNVISVAAKGLYDKRAAELKKESKFFASGASQTSISLFTDLNRCAERFADEKGLATLDDAMQAFIKDQQTATMKKMLDPKTALDSRSTK